MVMSSNSPLTLRSPTRLARKRADDFVNGVDDCVPVGVDIERNIEVSVAVDSDGRPDVRVDSAGISGRRSGQGKYRIYVQHRRKLRAKQLRVVTCSEDRSTGNDCQGEFTRGHNLL
jgi:hypothetical protein